MSVPFENIGVWNDAVLVHEYNWKSIYKKKRLKDDNLETVDSNSHTHAPTPTHARKINTLN